MKYYIIVLVTLFGNLYSTSLFAQINEQKVGAWYMLFWNAESKSSNWGLQGDVQYRNWNTIGDLEQLLIRSGITYKLKESNSKFTLGYANIQSGAYGSSNALKGEHRIYQEALLPQKIGQRIYLKHRFRYEQRFVLDQDFRTRYRYNLFLTVPLNHTELKPKTAYLSFYNELFINGQRQIGNSQTVELFDRNRLYGGIGYVFSKNLSMQLGFLDQHTDNWSKQQLQLSANLKL